MDEQRRQKLGQPPGVCADCWKNQTHNPSDEHREAYHCHHNNAMAMPNAAGTGWCIFTGVSREEYRARAESAATTVDLLAAAAKKMI